MSYVVRARPETTGATSGGNCWNEIVPDDVTPRGRVQGMLGYTGSHKGATLVRMSSTACRVVPSCLAALDVSTNECGGKFRNLVTTRTGHLILLDQTYIKPESTSQ